MIKLKEKIGYGLGDMASSMFWKLFGSYLMIFYTDVFGMSAAVVGTMFLVTRVWDSAFDPMSESLPTALIHGGGSSALICYFLLFRLPSSESLLLLLPNGA